MADDLLNEMIKEFQGILKYLDKNKEIDPSKELPKDYEDRVDRLKQIVSVFSEITDVITKDDDLKKDLAKVVATLDKIPLKFRKPLQEITKMKRELELEKLRVSRIIRMKKGEMPKPDSLEEEPSEDTDKKKEIKRKKKFDPLGGKKNWDKL